MNLDDVNTVFPTFLIDKTTWHSLQLCGNILNASKASAHKLKKPDDPQGA